jgi:Phosphodiester glycosidase
MSDTPASFFFVSVLLFVMVNLMARLSITATLLVLLFSSSTSVSSQAPANLKNNPTLAVTDSGSWKVIQKGVEFRKIALERSEPSHSIDLKLLRFDTHWIVPRILRSAQFQLKGATAKTFVEKSGALATINANYFDTEGKPLAFLKVASQAINARIAKTSLYTGVFSIKDQRPFISHRDDFLPEQADEGLQCGPLLLLHGTAQPVTGVPSRASRRALIGIDQEQRLVIAVTDSLLGGLHWPELQEIFSATPWQIQVTDLLNLDGGGSAQLYVKAGKFEEMVAGTAEVPVAIGFFSRAN